MKKLHPYIVSLLREHDCVIIPEYGGFVARMRGARYDAASGMFLSPGKEISFNRNLIQDDGLLISTIAQKNRSGYEESRAFVSKQVKDGFLLLKKERNLLLQDIGEFYYDGNDILCFEPIFSSALLPKAFGLSSFSFPELDRIEEKPKSIFSAKSKKKALPKVVQPKVTTPKATRVREISETPEKKIGRFTYREIAAAAAIVGFLLLSIPVSRQNIPQTAGFGLDMDTPAINSSYPGSRQSVVIDRLVDSNNAVPNVVDVDEQSTVAMVIPESRSSKNQALAEIVEPTPISHSELTKSIEAPVSKIDKPVSKKEAPVSKISNPGFYIVIGSVKNMTEANEMKAIFSKKGIDSDVLKCGNKYRITANVFNTRELAFEALYKMRETSNEFQKAWVYAHK